MMFSQLLYRSTSCDYTYDDMNNNNKRRCERKPSRRRRHVSRNAPRQLTADVSTMILYIIIMHGFAFKQCTSDDDV